MIESFEPISSNNSVILILGTMPGEESIIKKEYYAHKNNTFWDIMVRILNNNWDKYKLAHNMPYNERVNILVENKIALWDVIKCCERKGSLDNKITDIELNDIKKLLIDCPKIKYIFFNGHKASDFFKKMDLSIKYNYNILPSTSPSNNLNPFNKLFEWSKIKDII